MAKVWLGNVEMFNFFEEWRISETWVISFFFFFEENLFITTENCRWDMLDAFSICSGR